jgi:hypothetical protein
LWSFTLPKRSAHPTIPASFARPAATVRRVRVCHFCKRGRSNNGGPRFAFPIRKRFRRPFGRAARADAPQADAEQAPPTASAGEDAVAVVGRETKMLRIHNKRLGPQFCDVKKRKEFCCRERSFESSSHRRIRGIPAGIGLEMSKSDATRSE